MHTLIEELKQYHNEKAHHLFELKAGVSSMTENGFPKDTQRVLRHLFQPFQNPAERIHHHNEELILHELRTTAAPIHRRVDEICSDHAALDRIVARLATGIEQPLLDYREVCAEILHFIQTYDDHASGEESIFFPISDQYLERTHWMRISDSWK